MEEIGDVFSFGVVVVHFLHHFLHHFFLHLKHVISLPFGRSFFLIAAAWTSRNPHITSIIHFIVVNNLIRLILWHFNINRDIFVHRHIVRNWNSDGNILIRRKIVINLMINNLFWVSVLSGHLSLLSSVNRLRVLYSDL